MIELLREIGITLSRNKLRTFLTGFSIAWGIFMLMILLGAGNGLRNGVTANFESQSTNKITMMSGHISKPTAGKKMWERVLFDANDSAFLNSLSEVADIIPAYSTWGALTYKNKTVNASANAVLPKSQQFDNIKVISGRFINDIDIKEKRKVGVIAEKDALVLFDKEDPLEKQIICRGIAFTVVGVYKVRGAYWSNDFYVPFTTLGAIYNPSGKLSEFTFTVNGLETIEANQTFEENLRLQMSRRHEFNPEDRNAIHIWNTLEQYMETMKIFKAITIFVWIIGIGTLIAGIVGVGNIMLITVRERTKEFGIQKALGARPNVILRQIVLEALCITGLFGYLGMVAGIGITELINFVMVKAAESSDTEFRVFTNPTVDLRIAVASTVVLIIAGVLAGYFPARKAVKIKPIEALRYE
ncbi:MAG: ABC transporter permease [Bacteroidetes bacterium]|nr:ABC transporter permease [Bacteroidota bacterium]MCL1968712.1 ABC transporter permease [Bacteroidota bacterium]